MRQHLAIVVATLALSLAAGALQGCTELGTVNRSFAVRSPDAQAALAEMADDREPLARPVVVLGGYSDPGIAAPRLAAELRKVLAEREGARVITVSFPFCVSFDQCRDRVIRAVDKLFPNPDDPTKTAEVDVIGISMGGLVARHAAAPEGGGTEGARRLNVRRLFTVSSPHRGARLAALPTFSFGRLQGDMRAGSDFLTALDERECAAALAASAARAEDGVGGGPPDPFAYIDYELYPYVRLGDGIVGPENAAPAGMTPIWVPSLPLQDPHILASSDARIIADIARHLRDEPPFATYPPQPLPGTAAGELPAEAGSPASPQGP